MQQFSFFFFFCETEYYIFKPRLITRLEQGVDLFAKDNDVPGERQQGEAGVSRSDTSAGESQSHSNACYQSSLSSLMLGT